jgi:hypothetical protein
MAQRGALDLEGDQKAASSVNRASSSAPEGRTVATSAAAGEQGWF